MVKIFDMWQRICIRFLLLILNSLLIMIGCYSSLQAGSFREDSTQNSPWFSLGLGGATHRFAASVNVSYPIGIHLFSAHFIYMTEVKLTIPAPQFGGPSQPADKDVEYAILYGVHKDGDFALVSISTGISVVQARHILQKINSFISIYERENVVSIGIPLEVQLIFNTGRTLSCGITYFANYNRHYSYDGGLFSIRYRI